MAFKRINSLTPNLIQSGNASNSANVAARGHPQLQRSRSAIELGGRGTPGDGGPPPSPSRLGSGSMLGPRRMLSWLRDKGPTIDESVSANTPGASTQGGSPRSQSSTSDGRSSSDAELGPGRPISTVATPTVTDSKGRVRDPGHVQLQSSPEEQAQYGVGPVLGHSPQTGLRPGSRKVEHETGTFPDGQPFDIKAVRSPALPAGQDKVMKDASIRHDHGHMTPEQAERFKSYEGQPVSPEYQTVRDNCVTGYDEMFSGVMDRSPQNPPVGTRPQDIADANRNVRTDGSDLERK